MVVQNLMRSVKIGFVAVLVSYALRLAYPYIPDMVRPNKWYSHEFLKGVLICWVSSVLGAYDTDIITSGIVNWI